MNEHLISQKHVYTHTHKQTHVKRLLFRHLCKVCIVGVRKFHKAKSRKIELFNLQLRRQFICLSRCLSKNLHPSILNYVRSIFLEAISFH
jgi:hypothetical protein